MVHYQLLPSDVLECRVSSYNSSICGTEIHIVIMRSSIASLVCLLSLLSCYLPPWLAVGNVRVSGVHANGLWPENSGQIDCGLFSKLETILWERMAYISVLWCSCQWGGCRQSYSQ